MTAKPIGMRGSFFDLPRSAAQSADGGFSAALHHLPNSPVLPSRGCYVRKTRNFLGTTLAMESQMAAQAKASLAGSKVADKLASGVPMNANWSTPAGVKYTLFLKMIRAIRSDVCKRRFRGMGRYRSKLFAKMSEHFDTGITHVGNSGLKAARAGWNMSVPDQETFDDWNGWKEYNRKQA